MILLFTQYPKTKERNMPELNQTYEFNSLYVCLLLFLYNLWNSNSEYITIFLSKIYSLNHTYLFIIIINAVGIYLFLKNVNFEIKIQCSIKYK
jgi:hypothetical protein